MCKKQKDKKKEFKVKKALTKNKNNQSNAFSALCFWTVNWKNLSCKALLQLMNFWITNKCTKKEKFKVIKALT